MKELTHLSLFSGIGGLDMAAGWAGLKTVGQCEWAEYPTRVLERHWPDVPRWRDIRTLTREDFYAKTGRRTVDVISGGFPCQPFSVAGKRRGREDDRYLWPEMARVIKELRPTWVVGENVAGIVRMALPDILSELESLGYRTRAFLIPACAVGARHRRYRVAIVGYSEHDGPSSATIRDSTEEASRGEQKRANQASQSPGASQSGNSADVDDTKSNLEVRLPIRKSEEKPGFGIGGENVPDTEVPGFSDSKRDGEAGQSRLEYSSEKGRRERGRRPAEPGLGGVADGLPDRVDGYWDVEPDIPRIAAGVPHRADRLKALGNAVVPQQFYPIFRAIAEVERRGYGEIDRKI